MELQKIISLITRIDPIFSIVATILGILATLFGIFYLRERRALIKLKKQNAQKSSNDFTALVDRLDRKVSAFANYLVSRSGTQHQKQYQHLGSPISQDTSSLFDLRVTHYAEEKFKICKRTLEHILKENKTVSKAKHVLLLIDSGSTVYPIFRLLTQYYNNREYTDTLSKFVLFTNDIAGITELIRFGRKGSGYNAEMLIECNVIPGKAEGKYGAILGKDSGTHLKYFIEKDYLKKYPDLVVISLLTGNYISVTDGILWRGDHHGTLKNYLVDLSNVVYILSPLGKIFRKSKNDVNGLITDSNYILSPSKSYKDLSDNDAVHHQKDDNNGNNHKNKIKHLVPQKYAKNNDIYLVTTQRQVKQRSKLVEIK